MSAEKDEEDAIQQPQSSPSGVEDDQVDPMLKILEAYTEVRVSPPSSARLSENAQVSRAVVFVLQLERLAKL